MFIIFSLQTCYEMERYLKDEPKQHAYKKLAADLDTPWDLFTAPGPISGSWKVEVDPYCIEELNINDKNLDNISMSSSSSPCSGVSWDSSLSCAVVVKKEKLDLDDDDNNSDSYDDESFAKIPFQSRLICKNTDSTAKIHVQSTPQNSIELRLVARKTSGHEILPTLTPPSSPESHLSISNNNKNSITTVKTEPEIALLDHQGILRVSTGAHIPRNTIVRLTTANNKSTVGLTRVIQVSPQFQAALAQRNTANSPNSTSGKDFKRFHYF